MADHVVGALRTFGTKVLTAMRHALGWSWAGGAVRSSAAHDYAAEVGDGLDASVVMTPISWLQRAVIQAPLVIERLRGEGERVPEHPLAQLLARPNPGYSTSHLLQSIVWSLCAGGNAYLLKVRTGGGRVAELWYVPHWLITPRWPVDGSQFVSHYEYQPGGDVIRVEPTEVVHVRMGVDPHNPRLGLAPLRSALRDVWSDMECSVFVAALLRNSGVPGLVISPDGAVAAAPADIEAVKQYLSSQFSGERRGQPLVFSSKTKVDRIGFRPDELDLRVVSDRAEERVCALLGIPSVVVGLHAGSSQTSVGATMREQVRLAWHNAVLPMQALIASELARSLLPDFERDPEQWSLYFDTNDVEALQEEHDKIITRIERMMRAGIITVREARQMAGMQSDATHDVYLRPMGMMEIPLGGMAALDVGKRKSLPAPDAKHVHEAAEIRIATTAPHVDEPPARYVRYLAEIEIGTARAERQFARELVAYFRELGQAAARAYEAALADGEPKALKDAALLDTMLTDRVIEAMEMPRMRRLFTDIYERHFLHVAGVVAGAGGALGLAVNLPDVVARSVLATGGTRAGLVDIENRTRDHLFETLATARADGAGVDDIMRRIEDAIPAGPWASERIRARVIARTETAFAQNYSVIEHGNANGVDRYLVFDARLGDTDEVCMMLDGAIVTPDEASVLNANEHPNGTRSFTPYFGD